MLKICKENDENSSYMSSPKTLRVSAQYLQFPRFRALLFVKRARFLVMEESWDIVWFISTGVTTSRARSGAGRNDRNTSGQRENKFNTSYRDISDVVSESNSVIKPICEQYTSLNKM